MKNALRHTFRKCREGCFAATIVAGLILAMGSIGSGSRGGKKSILKAGYAPVNWLNLYYEVYVGGKPLIPLRGRPEQSEMLGGVLTELERLGKWSPRICRRTVTRRILTDLRAEAIAYDIAGLMKHLGIPKADVMGYSLGAGVALQVTIRHPQLVWKSLPCRHWYRRLRRSWTLPCRKVSDGFLMAA